MNSTDPLIVKCFEASTIHITKQDDALLNREDLSAFAIYVVKGGSISYGYLVYTGMDDDLENWLGTKKIAEEAGFSQAFTALIDLARQSGCKFLQLDCDGVEYDDLPKFNW